MPLSTTRSCVNALDRGLAREFVELDRNVHIAKAQHSVLVDHADGDALHVVTRHFGAPPRHRALVARLGRGLAVNLRGDVGGGKQTVTQVFQPDLRAGDAAPHHWTRPPVIRRKINLDIRLCHLHRELDRHSAGLVGRGGADMQIQRIKVDRLLAKRRQHGR